MTIGYIGLRYIELSISSPICNSSGALVAVLALATGGLGDLVPAQLVATALVCVGVIGLGIVEAREDDDLRAARQEASNHRYAKSCAGPGAAGDLLPAGRAGHLCRQPRAGNAGRGQRQLRL